MSEHKSFLQFKQLQMISKGNSNYRIGYLYLCQTRLNQINKTLKHTYIWNSSVGYREWQKHEALIFACLFTYSLYTHNSSCFPFPPLYTLFLRMNTIINIFCSTFCLKRPRFYCLQKNSKHKFISYFYRLFYIELILTLQIPGLKLLFQI